MDLNYLDLKLILIQETDMKFLYLYSRKDLFILRRIFHQQTFCNFERLILVVVDDDDECTITAGGFVRVGVN
jgi:hypothetical protein